MKEVITASWQEIYVNMGMASRLLLLLVLTQIAPQINERKEQK